MNRLQFLWSLLSWGALFYLSCFCAILAIGYENYWLLFALIPATYSFFKLLHSGYKRVVDIFPSKDLGLLIIGFVVVISLVPFGTLLLLLLPGNLLKGNNEPIK